jgi:hypothetical protein
VNPTSAPQTGPVLVRLDPRTLERLAARTAELLADRLDHSKPAGTQLPELLTVAEVSAWWGVHRGWVYEHAAELGAIRIGGGQRPMLRFDPKQVIHRLARPPVRPQDERPARQA